MQKHLERSADFMDPYMDRLAMAAARDTWGKHPRELMGDSFDPRMLLDMMALKDWELRNTFNG